MRYAFCCLLQDKRNLRLRKLDRFSSNSSSPAREIKSGKFLLKTIQFSESGSPPNETHYEPLMTVRLSYNEHPF